VLYQLSYLAAPRGW
jgi:lactoylglutathione lyase